MTDSTTPAPVVGEVRHGETTLTEDPATLPPDATVTFIGRIETPWTQRSECPKNGLQGAHVTCRIHLDEAYRPGLKGVETCTHLYVFYWMHQARRDIIVQTPKHIPPGQTMGCFALRSPVRPNPISIAAVELVNIDINTGILEVRGLDCLSGTPLVDLKPYFAATDSRPEAVVGWKAELEQTPTGETSPSTLTPRDAATNP